MDFAIVENGQAGLASSAAVERAVATHLGTEGHTIRTIRRWKVSDLVDMGIYPVVRQMPVLQPYQRLGAETLTVLPDRVSATYTVEDLPLDQYVSSLTSLVDAEAEALRAEFLTAGSGQAMTYQALSSEVLAYKVDPAGVYPFLTALVGIDGDTIGDVVATIEAQVLSWSNLGARINAERRRAKVDLKTTLSCKDAHSVLFSFQNAMKHIREEMVQ